MIIYIFEMFFILFAGGLLYCKKLSKKGFLAISFFTMALVLGLRGINVGEDTAHFIDVFEKTNSISWKTLLTSGTDVVYETIWNIDRSMEVGYMAMNKFIRIFTSNPQWLLIIVAFLTFFLMGKFVYQNCENVFLPTYIIFCESFYMQSFNLMRQTLSIAIGLQAYTILKSKCKNSVFKATITIFIAFLFHKSAIVLLVLIPLWLVNDRKNILKLIIIGGTIAPVIINFMSKLILVIIPRYAGYFVNNYWEPNLGGIVILWVIEIFMIAYIFCKYKNKDGQEILLTTVCIVIYISLEIVGLKLTAFSRISLYFRVFLMFLFPFFSKYLNRESRLIYKVGLIVLLSVLFLRYANTPSRFYYFFWQ